MGLGSRASDLGSGIGGGEQSILLFVDKIPHTSFQQLALAKFFGKILVLDFVVKGE